MGVRRVVAAAGVVATAIALTSCGSTTSSLPSSSSSHPSGPVTPPPPLTASGTATATDPTPSPVGSSEHPAPLTAGATPLHWTSVPGSTKDLVTVGDGWTLTVVHGGSSARLAGPHPRTISAGAHASITDAYLDAGHALVVSEDRLAKQPDLATLVDLASGGATVLDGGSDPPTVVGGTWALGPDTLVHATSGSQHRYCLATVQLAGGATSTGATGWCAAPRHGFSRAAITGDGTTMMTFDNHHPSCRVLNSVEGTVLHPLPGVTPCKGWDSALLDGTTAWSVVPNDHRIEVAHFYAHTDGGWYDLGAGTSGSLVTCDGSAYFTRDPGSRTEPARLLRWSPADASLTVAYATTGTGNAFLSPPRCGGTHLTLTAYTSAGDTQVTTALN
jgi:hypothetical protein